MLKNFLIGAIIIVFSLIVAIQINYPGMFSGLFGLSTEEIGDRVTATMQAKFNNDPKFKPLNISVNSIKVIHKKDNEYEGLVNVTSDGDDHNLLIDITADKKNVIWKSKQDRFSALFEKRRQAERDRNNLMNYLMNNTGFR